MSTYIPDDTRRQQLECFIGSVCVGSTGRLGIVTHVDIGYGEWRCCGFGLDGKGVWTSRYPVEIAQARVFFNRLMERFNGRLSSLDVISKSEMDEIAEMVVDSLDQWVGNDDFDDFDD